MSSATHERFGHDKGPFETRQDWLRRLAVDLKPYLDELDEAEEVADGPPQP
jgi:hypothetical protein